MGNFIVDQSLCKIMYRVQKPKKHPIEYPIMLRNRDNIFYCYDGIFTARHWELLDSIGTCIAHCLFTGEQSNKENKLFTKIRIDGDVTTPYTYINFDKNLPNRTYNTSKILSVNKIDSNVFKFLDNEKIEDTDKKIERKAFENIRTFMFCDDSLIKCLPNKNKFSKNEINNLIKDLSSIKLRITYCSSYYDEETKKFKYESYTNNLPCPFFTVEIKDSLKKGKSNAKEYMLTFNTCIGYTFIQNIRSCNYFFLKDTFYELSPLSQFIYKNMIIPYTRKKFHIEDFRNRLRIKTAGGMNEIKKIIIENLNELKYKEFISSYKVDNFFIEMKRPSHEINKELYDFNLENVDLTLNSSKDSKIIEYKKKNNEHI